MFYLGLPLSAKFRDKDVWEPVTERVRRELISWKAPLLSKGGRLTLIKSSLVSVSNYFLSLFTNPWLVALKNEQSFWKLL